MAVAASHIQLSEHGHSSYFAAIRTAPNGPATTWAYAETLRPNRFAAFTREGRPTIGAARAWRLGAIAVFTAPLRGRSLPCDVRDRNMTSSRGPSESAGSSAAVNVDDLHAVAANGALPMTLIKAPRDPRRQRRQEDGGNVRRSNPRHETLQELNDDACQSLDVPASHPCHETTLPSNKAGLGRPCPRPRRQFHEPQLRPVRS